MTDYIAPVEIEREIELDPEDGWWTVWEDGDHVALFLTEDEAKTYVAEVEAVEAIDRDLFSNAPDLS